MQRNIKKLGIDSGNIENFEQVLFKWSATNFESDTTGNKAIIYEISDKAVKVIFDKNNNHKQQMTTGENWQKFYYIVDVTATYDGNMQPKLYKITNYYPEETFSDED